MYTLEVLTLVFDRGRLVDAGKLAGRILKMATYAILTATTM